jgi:hypothetical protein
MRALFRVLPWIPLAVLLAVRSPPARASEWGDARKDFRRAQRSDDWKVRRDAYVLMLPYDGERAVEEVLRGMEREDNPAVLVTGMETLATFLSPEAVATLVKALAKSKGSDRLHLIMAVGMRTDDAGDDVLLKLVKDRDEQAAAQAALALGQKRVKEALPAFLDLLQSDEWQLRAAGARAIRLLVGPPPEPPPPGKEEKPWLPEGFDPAAVVPGLAEALGKSEGSERGDIIRTLERVTRQTYGNDPDAWKAMAAGTPAEKIRPNPRPTPYIFGMPIYGRRVVLIVDISTCTDDTHPFDGMDRLKEVCQVPGGRPVPWYNLRTTKQFIRAHAKRLIDDLPDDAKFEVIAVFQRTESLFGRLTPANSGTRRQAATWLDELAIQNGPNHYEALMAALDVSGASDNVAWSLGPDEIILMTCAIPWAPRDPNAIVNQEEIGRIVGLKARLRMVPIDTVGVGPHPFGMMKAISDLSGGVYEDLSK